MAFSEALAERIRQRLAGQSNANSFSQSTS
jgi:hypothetical protein